MKKFLIWLVLSAALFAQEEKKDNTGVELPEFVITGQNITNLQLTKKPAAEMVPVVSQEFLRPAINPETPEIMDLGGPSNANLQLRDSMNINTGRIKTMLGVYTIPMAELFISSPLQSGILSGKLEGENIRPYVDNAERYFLNAAANYSIFNNYEASFLPGAEYQVKADFNSKSYKLFAGNIPTYKRKLYQGSLGASVKSLYSNTVIFGVSGDFKSSSLGDENYSENLFVMGGFGKAKLDDIEIGIKAQYSSLTFEDSVYSLNTPDFFRFHPYAGIELSRALKISAGINYTKAGSNNFTGLYAAAAYKMNDNISFYGEYTPSGEYITSSGLLEKNIYFNPRNTPDIFVKKSHDLTGSVKYQFEKYFEINGGFRYRAYKDLPYYSEMQSDGTFGIERTKADHYSWFANLIFHRGPYGYFYGSFEGGTPKNDENLFIPYFPSVFSSLTYGYDFPINVSAEVKIFYRTGIYADIVNIVKLPAYAEINLMLSYGFNTSFRFIGEINNILNRKNYLWINYREKPADFMAGISYSW